MQVKATKFGALLLASATALALSNVLPVQSFPQWVKLRGESSDLYYDFNSLKSLPNGVKLVDVYSTPGSSGYYMYISCPRWRSHIDGSTKWVNMSLSSWRIIPPGSKVEALAYKLCGKR